MYGLDDRKFENLMQINLTRKRVHHAAFGFGPHICPGAYVARIEFRVFIEECLRRIPDFREKPDERILACWDRSAVSFICPCSGRSSRIDARYRRCAVAGLRLEKARRYLFGRSRLDAENER